MASRQTVPPAILVAETEEARAALGNRSEVRITEVPFNVGREDRVGRLEKLRMAVERRLGGLAPVNDLFLVEPPSDTLHISREHFAIGYEDGEFVLVDRESACGTSVGDARVGSDQTARRAILQDGDSIVVGPGNSPYVFRFQLKL